VDTTPLVEKPKYPELSLTYLPTISLKYISKPTLLILGTKKPLYYKLMEKKENN